MLTSTHLLARRRFLPLFASQSLGVFNDNLFRYSIVYVVVYGATASASVEVRFSALASALFMLPYIFFSALAGQLADTHDKAAMIRVIKLAEVIIMMIGGGGLLLAAHGPASSAMAVPLMLAALIGMGVHSTFIGPIKYAILPQHLRANEVLAGTGLVEAGTNVAILAGTILAGVLPAQWAALVLVATALAGLACARTIPPAPPALDLAGPGLPLLTGLHGWMARLAPAWPVRAVAYAVLAPIWGLVALADATLFVKHTLHLRRLMLATLAISLFWAIGTVLFTQFLPLAKEVLAADRSVASLMLGIFSVGVATGAMAINVVLKGRISARFAPAAALTMAVMVLGFAQISLHWPPSAGGTMLDLAGFLAQPLAWPLMLCLFGISLAGGAFVVPLYALLTTTVDKAHTSRIISANNIVNSLAMVAAAGAAGGLDVLGVAITRQVLLSAGLALLAAWLGWLVNRSGPAAAR